jgi:hypothetical protein
MSAETQDKGFLLDRSGPAPAAAKGNVSRATSWRLSSAFATSRKKNRLLLIDAGISAMTSYEEGFLMGVLVGEGHFGGDRFHAHVILHMHTRQKKLLSWFLMMVPGSKLYGPYLQNGRHCMQWMARGKALRQELLPILQRNLDRLDDHIQQRIRRMIEKYKLCEQGLLEWPSTDPADVR